MEGVFLYTGSIIVIVLIMIVVMLHFIRKVKSRNFYGRLETYVKDERNIGRKSWRTLDKSLEKGIDVFADFEIYRFRA